MNAGFEQLIREIENEKCDIFKFMVLNSLSRLGTSSLDQVFLKNQTGKIYFKIQIRLHFIKDVKIYFFLLLNIYFLSLPNLL